MEVVLLVVGALSATGKPGISYNRDVRPILSNRCFKCHGPDLQKAGLDLQTAATATKKLRSGDRAIVPGDAAKSTLLQRVTAEEAQERMPPKGDPLTPQEVRILRTWIEQGAGYEEHWAYVKPVRPPLPAVKNRAWVRNGIDAFILARLEQEGLSPTAEAEPAVLLRRVSLDLTGLPPTREELERFLGDKKPGAYERAVDRLLASTHYGEHQARYWLDLARYADTNGYEKDERRSIWPYRDWVIRAFNRNLPFDQFTLEQLAGDLLPQASVDQQIATGFHRNTMVNTEGGTDDEEFRVAAVVDRVNTTMEVWMATTMACAQCHNHKYDPFSQKEYYQLFAFFNNTADPGRNTTPHLEIPTAEQVAQRAQLQEALRRAERERTVAGLLGGSGVGKVLGDRVAARKKALEAIRPTTTMVLRELPRPRVTHVMLRGNHKNKGEQVIPAVPARLHPLPVDAPSNRLGLAQWLVSEENPLTPRVLMNRLWGRLFGRGLVETSEEFGAQGEQPTHPELLDWLATEVIRQKWDLKAIQKLLVTSATYRQSSRVTPDLLKKDPLNRLYGRGPRFRLDAETVRDNALSISGLLDRKVGGPSVFPYQPDGIWFNPYSGDRWVLSPGGDRHRRGLYTFWRRTAPYAAFLAFDAPSREVCTERRPRTNTPLQALATLNDPVFVEASLALARRMLTEGGTVDQARVEYGFRLCVARKPTAQETGLLLELYREAVQKYRKDVASAKQLVASLPGGPKVDVVEWAAWSVVANVLLNLDETIMRG